jgi:predicted transcriptional regulator
MRSEVYSWRVSPEMKAKLEDLARRRRQSVAKLLEQLVDRALRSFDMRDEVEQRERRASAARFVGSLHGRDPHRAAQAGARARARIKSKHAR